MRKLAVAVVLVCACWVGSLLTASHAQAEILITINKSAQRMSVSVNGTHRYTWAVSTGLDGGPPTGTFRPDRLERKWFSRKYDWSPMPHSIFFYHGYAIHGTNEVGKLGRPASHGCIRLSPGNARALYGLVSRHGMANTRITITY